MSITVIVRFPVADVVKGVEALEDHAALLDEITDASRGAGCLRHRFVAGDRELLVIDEWDSAEHFEMFFAKNAKIQQITDAIGLSRPPAVSVFNSIDVAGTL
jgi:hypothetical protein